MQSVTAGHIPQNNHVQNAHTLRT